MRITIFGSDADPRAVVAELSLESIKQLRVENAITFVQGNLKEQHRPRGADSVNAVALVFDPRIPFELSTFKRGFEVH